jgi:hypothetical protein
MKKIYAVLAVSLIVLFTSCSKKSDPKPNNDEEAATNIIGSWELTKRMVTVYQQGKLLDSVDEANHVDPTIATFRVDGTGKESNSIVDVATFTYTANKEGITYHEFNGYRLGASHSYGSGPFIGKFKSFTVDKMVFYEYDSFFSQGSKVNTITESTFLKVK